jgi:glycosyltransferase involved in cell wall biosynthesis
MISKLLAKFAALLLRGHHFIMRRLQAKKAVAPRVLRYKVVPGLPKIFHFNGNFTIGGTSQLIADIIENTSDRYEHRVFVPVQPSPLPYQPLPIQAFPLSDMQGLYEYLKKEQPALVHIHYWIRPMHRYMDFGLWYKAVFDICDELGLKVIQNIDVPTAPYPAKNLLHNVYVSQYVLDEFNNSEKPCSVIYPGSDMQHFSKKEGSVSPDHVIGMVYRLDTDKLNEKAIEVFISAVKLMPSLQCYIIGGGYYFDAFRERVRQEGQEKNFIFTGFVSYDALPDYYKKIGLIVAPVHDESFGQVTPFAMGMGLPVAGFDTGALKEILGSSEMLVPYGEVQALAERIVQVMQSPDWRKKTGTFNRQRALDYFTVEKMIGDYTSLYQQYLS